MGPIPNYMQYPEYHLQVSINDLLSRARTCLYFHVPNRPKNAIEWRKQKAMGARAGVSDMVFPAAGSRFLEFKAEGKRGTQSPDQKSFQAECEEYDMEYALTAGFDEAYEQIKQWGLI